MGTVQFQHTAARRRLARRSGRYHAYHSCFNTQPPEGGWKTNFDAALRYDVSTHSRPKAAGRISPGRCRLTIGFNTQPPEGGWSLRRRPCHTPIVSTHSRPKAAGPVNAKQYKTKSFQHTAARRRLEPIRPDKGGRIKFQHTAARRRLGQPNPTKRKERAFQHTAARRRLEKQGAQAPEDKKFQHTAARRRLVLGF